MKSTYVTYVLSIVLVLEILLSTVIYSGPSFTATSNYLGGVDYVTVYPKDASMNITPVLLIIGLTIFSVIILIFEKLRFQQKKVVTEIRAINDFEVPTLLCIMQIAFLIRLFFLSSQPLQSDEGMYTYISSLVAKGFIPYRDVFLAHTPLSIYITAFFIYSFGAFYPSIRLISLCLFTFTIALTYLLSKVVLAETKGRYPLLAAALYAFYPSWFITYSFVSAMENLLALFTLSTAVTYALFHMHKKRKYLILSGFLGGCALAATLRAVYFLVPLAIFHIAYLVWTRNADHTSEDGLSFGFGFIIPTGIMLGYFALNGALHYLYLDVIVYQISLFPKEAFFSTLMWYLNNTWPLLLLCGVGTFSAIKMSRHTKKIVIVIPSFLFFSNLLFILSGVLSGGFFIHYLYYLCPLASVVAISGISKLKDAFPTNKKNKMLIGIFLLVLVFSIRVTANYTLTNTLPYFSQFPYDKVDNYIGMYINNITRPSDYIWSGEAAIGFFSGRTIVAPYSDFRFIGLYDWSIGFDFGIDKGTEMKGYTNGFVNVDDFILSWESNNVNVLVFIMNKGWVPYIDPLLWNGYRNQTGVAGYVMKNYSLREVITCESNPYTYYLWVRKV